MRVRLRDYEIEAIRECAKEVFKNPEIWIFGSRANLNEKGGDIDIYIRVEYEPDIWDKNRYYAKLIRKIGEQKIDIVIDYPQKVKDLIDKEALKGVRIE
ncbi:MAG: nucleotidyltransferase domain-containing protein [Epsilonproteobacteria bacterium]|nr:nucleotidyltransferase domain-containing protein [Campylobacterota bacterium]